jgi:hypothetical protein
LGRKEAQRKLIKQDYDALLLYNKTGANLVDTKSNKNLLSIIDRPTISWLTEHPVTFFSDYKKTNSSKRGYIYTNSHHNLFSKKTGLEGASCSMLFGSSVKNKIIEYNSREFDICIAAQWRGVAEVNEFWKGEASFKNDFFGAVNLLQNLEDNGDVFTAFLAAAENYKVPLDNIEKFMRK